MHNPCMRGLSILLGCMLGVSGCVPCAGEQAQALREHTTELSVAIDAEGRKVRLLEEARVYFGQQLVYAGRTRCEHARCWPEGPHHVYHLDGKLQRVIDYRESRTHQFEGVPDLERTTTWVDEQGRPMRVTNARACTECEWQLYGKVRTRQANGSWQALDVASFSHAERVALEQEANEENHLPPLLGNPFSMP